MDADDPICLTCIGDDELRRLLSDKASRSVCASCGKRRKAAPLREVAEHIDGVYREYYAPGGDVAHFDKDSDNPRYEQEGEAPEWIIQEIAGVEPDISEAVVAYLDYDATSNYVARDLHPTELRLAWEEFRRRVKHERRFFDEQGRLILSTILGDRESIRRSDNPLSACIVTLKAGERCFRARRADTKEAADFIIGDPRRQLVPPPPHLTPAGRMNPAGIPVFYGGFSEDICIAEVRPHVGGIVVVGEFRAARRLQLLDLTMLDQHGFAGSMFRADFYDRVTKRRFLRSFHNLISRPVQPHEEALEYVPTQAVAEYIANVLGLDGIIYESAQAGGLNDDEEEEDTPADRSTQNVAFFNRSALVVGSRRRQTRAERQAAILEGEGLNDHAGKQSRPSLSFVPDSAKAVRVTAIKVSHAREF
jgi:RES domain/HEPN/RES N-terminal domain 1